MSTGAGPIIVIGLGNEDRSDDACGRWVARRLRRWSAARIEESNGDPAELLELWDGASVAFVADALLTGAAPGTVRRVELSGSPTPAELDGTSTHGLGLREALGLGEALGRAPWRCVVVGIEPGSLAPGRGLSAPVSAAVDRVVATLAGELRALGVPASPDASRGVVHA